MAKPRHRPKTVKQLHTRLSRVLPDPKGDRLRNKIAACGVEADVRRWLPWSEADLRVRVALPMKPSITDSWVIKVTTIYDPIEVLLVQFNQAGEPRKFFTIPHPEAEV